jgi:hypothetical protein
VARVGFGTFRYNISSNSGNAMNGPLGSFNYTTTSAFYGYHVNGGTVYTDQAETTPKTFTVPSGLNQNGSSPYADKKRRKQDPLRQHLQLRRGPGVA